MTRWEYLAIDFERHGRMNDLGDTERYFFVSFLKPGELGFPADQRIQEMNSVLDRLGQVGWELVNLVPYSSSNGDQVFKAMLKRPA